MPVHFGVFQEGLRRDAAPVQADSSEFVLLDHRRAETELRSPDRGNVPPGSAADDRQIKLSFGHWVLVEGENGSAACEKREAGDRLRHDEKIYEIAAEKSKMLGAPRRGECYRLIY